jgi:F-type H+-transporting ATPase subunit c
MKRGLFFKAFALFLCLAAVFSWPVFIADAPGGAVVHAQEAHGAAPEAAAAPQCAAPAPPAGGDKNGEMTLALRDKFITISAILSATVIIVAVISIGTAQGFVVVKAIDAIGRNPESQKKLFPILILGLAFIESVALYALLISLSLLFFNPLIPKL